MVRRALLLGVLVTVARPAAAEQCRTLGVDYLPAPSTNADASLRMPLSIVAWLETPSGVFVDTVFITEQVGTYGLGNRPGRYDFNSGPDWPYGRRITTFPVWAHRHGMQWDQIVFQDGNDSNLSHDQNHSSDEGHYFRPMIRSEPVWDAMTRASPIGPFTDKGVFGSAKSLYPPRADVTHHAQDSASVGSYAQQNPFDMVSQASPESGVATQFSWTMGSDLPSGDYVLWMEVAREFDHNATYSPEAYPSPMVPYGDYGLPYRGQPSVIYTLPFTIAMAPTAATTDAYAGYGDPDGLDGAVRVPDGTITVDTPGSGAQRLALVPGGNYRVRVTAGMDPDALPPRAPGTFSVATTSSTAVLSFVAPGDDDLSGTIKRYDVRYLVGEAITDDNFDRATQIRPSNLHVAPGGALQTMTFERLLPETDYSFAIRAYDNCENPSEIAVAAVRTGLRTPNDVDACFIATAAYGSVLANDVVPLRTFRDAVLKHSVLGELAVETYYTFSPSLAQIVGESELLRWTARDVLAPIVRAVRGL